MRTKESGHRLVRAIGIRWVVCGLLFCATTLNYYNRQILGLLKPELQHLFGWSERDYGFIIQCFQLAYACGLLVMGRVVDVLGVRVTLAFSVGLWSLASLAHAFAASVVGFAAARALLGFAEAGNFPASVSAVADWFSRRERALAIGIFNAGSNIGAMIGPIVVPLTTELMGWQGAFVVAGSLGALWLAGWLVWYRRPEDHRLVTREELAWIRADRQDTARSLPPVLTVARQPLVLGMCVARALTDPVWAFLLFWSPDFFAKQFGLGLRGFAIPIVCIYLAADVGGIVGGLLSSRLVAKGFDAARARLIVMLGAAVLTVSLLLAPHTSSLPCAVSLIALGASAHQAWSANVFALASDRLPQPHVGMVVGLSGAAGALGGMAMAGVVGYLLDRGAGYGLMFASVVCLYLTGWAVLRIAVNRQNCMP